MKAMVKLSLLTILAVLLSYAASESATYLYSGQPFTYYYGDYHEGDSISGELTLNDPLPPDLIYHSVTENVIAYSYSDGHQIFTEETPGVVETIIVSTDENGDIIAPWAISLVVSTEVYIQSVGESPTSLDGACTGSLSCGGNSGIPGTWQTSGGGTSVGAEEPAPRAVRFSCYPNPFNPRITLAFPLDQPGSVKIDVFDAAGRRVNCMRPGVLPTGDHLISWDGTDDSGRALPGGIYFMRLETGDRCEMIKSVMAR